MPKKRKKKAKAGAPVPARATDALRADIEATRARLEALVDEHGPGDPRVIRLSRMLDGKLNELRRAAG